MLSKCGNNCYIKDQQGYCQQGAETAGERCAMKIWHDRLRRDRMRRQSALHEMMAQSEATRGVYDDDF